MLKTLLYWLPRIAIVAYAALIGFFTFTAANIDGGFNITNLIPIILHSLPVLAVLGIIIASLKNESLGAMLFFILGVIVTIFHQTYLNITAFFILSLPLFLAGLLFYINHLRNNLK